MQEKSTTPRRGQRRWRATEGIRGGEGRDCERVTRERRKVPKKSESLPARAPGRVIREKMREEKRHSGMPYGTPRVAAKGETSRRERWDERSLHLGRNWSQKG